jgi:hypothetical protein
MGMTDIRNPVVGSVETSVVDEGIETEEVVVVVVSLVDEGRLVEEVLVEMLEEGVLVGIVLVISVLFVSMGSVKVMV